MPRLTESDREAEEALRTLARQFGVDGIGVIKRAAKRLARGRPLPKKPGPEEADDGRELNRMADMVLLGLSERMAAGEIAKQKWYTQTAAKAYWGKPSSRLESSQKQIAERLRGKFAKRREELTAIAEHRMSVQGIDENTLTVVAFALRRSKRSSCSSTQLASLILYLTRSTAARGGNSPQTDEINPNPPG